MKKIVGSIMWALLLAAVALWGWWFFQTTLPEGYTLIRNDLGEYSWADETGKRFDYAIVSSKFRFQVARNARNWYRYQQDKEARSTWRIVE